MTPLAIFTKDIINAYGKFLNPSPTLKDSAIAGFKEKPLIGTVQMIPAYTISGTVTTSETMLETVVSKWLSNRSIGMR